MKKLLSLLLVAGLVAGCSQKAPEQPTDGGNETATTTYKMGLGSTTSVKGADAGEKAGSAQVDTTIAAVVLDADGKVVYVDIDTAQNKATFGTDGLVAADADAADSKKVKKEAYNMKAASAIGKEWYEQIEGLEAWMVGKTIDEIKALAVDESNHPTDEDVIASCTMAVGDFLVAVEDAANNAVEVEGAEKFGAANTTSMKKADAGEKDGQVQLNTTFTATAFDAEGNVVATLIDTAQNTVKFDATGKVTSAEAAPTKKVKKEAYNMKGASAIGKEWYEQIAGLEAWMAGKSVADITAIETDEAGHPTAEDVTASCTMSVNDFVKVVEMASNNAR